MRKIKSNFLGMSLSLLLITVVTAALLSMVYNVTKDPIEELKEITLTEGVKRVITSNIEGEIEIEDPLFKNGFEFYRAYGAKGQFLGTAVKSTDKNGYGGNIVVLVGFSPDGTILGYELLEHSETPGLGDQADEWFKIKSEKKTDKRSKMGTLFFGRQDPAGNHNIIGLNPGKNNLTLSKDGGEIDAITASTITSRAFLRAIVSAYNVLDGHETIDVESGATACIEEPTVPFADTVNIISKINQVEIDE
ncbi:MAG TPA: RnfABCDGE type electron transport complex subunit G [Bacteroidaceae bacterium]|nr:RnfABCDGE type electron transport complex subunit G [Bacteroidaceae bacterium]